MAAKSSFGEPRVTWYHPNPMALFYAENKSKPILQRVLLALGFTVKPENTYFHLKKSCVFRITLLKKNWG